MDVLTQTISRIAVFEQLALLTSSRSSMFQINSFCRLGLFFCHLLACISAFEQPILKRQLEPSTITLLVLSYASNSLWVNFILLALSHIRQQKRSNTELYRHYNLNRFFNCVGIVPTGNTAGATVLTEITHSNMSYNTANIVPSLNIYKSH